MEPTAKTMHFNRPDLNLLLALDPKPGFAPLRSTRHFRVIASDYTTAVVLAKAIQLIAERAPGVTVEILPPSADCSELISRDNADLMVSPVQFAANGLPGEVLLEDDYVCVAWIGNPLVGAALTREQYLELGHVCNSFGNPGGLGGRSLMDMALKAANVSRRVEVWANSFESIPSLLMNTNRIATLNTRLARRYARHFPLRLVATPVDMPVLVKYMQWSKVFARDPAHLWLRCLLKEVAESERFLVTDGR